MKFESSKNYIVSLWWGYCSGAALFLRKANGEIITVAASSEERFNRQKNSTAFPRNCLNWFRDEFGLKINNIETVVYIGNDVGIDYILLEKHLWSINDYIKENKLFYYPKLVLGQNIKEEDRFIFFNDKINLNQFPGEKYWKDKFPKGAEDFVNADLNEVIEEGILKYFETDISKLQIKRYDHHSSHAFYAYYTKPKSSRKELVFTLDGWGDGRNATVTLIELDENDIVTKKEIFSSNKSIIARVYRYITLLLGMKPSDHEFKVMGLAPYGKSKYGERCLDVFRSSLWYEDGDFKINPEIKDSYYWFKEKLEGERFDNIAYGLQKWLEEVVIQWVSYFTNITGVYDISFSGGVAMNVKAMGEISKLKNITSIHIPPSSGDESHIFGAAYSYFYENQIQKSYVKKFNVPYLGVVNNITNEEKSIAKISVELKKRSIKIVKNPTPRIVAESLASGRSVSVCRGAGEFGARALGSRSLLIDPTINSLKEKLNLSIKNRDFWMPFAPIVLDSFVKEYIEDPKNLATKYMTIAFPTTPLGYESLNSAVHPADRTCRIQVLERNDNEFIYDTISEFSIITGRGGLLNTSFNVHGSPIVNKTDEALEIFLNTDLDCLLLGNYFILKN
jgi:carbamoyltransferase